MSSYAGLQREHASSTPFSPLISPSAAQPLAIVLLSIAFVSSFYFSTLRPSKIPTTEIASALVASVLGGFGLVFAFCTLGVNI
ncbi:BQ5605_C007g04444 [Microbotryum silenes-dioicae]|uniref:Dolichyl-diphosphooligosaccharide-protein glycosyltransferase subunit OST5 n=1 Tax=Microbotryum silenes-dioicae TaxID=796604 RepID=A0A2X0MB66_9BASI|nr:BQ5605_C007g04444 [Microbotryum silenes-dioicae]